MALPASRNLLLLGWVSLLTDASSNMIFPLLPLFLTQVLGAAPLVVGLVEGAADSLTAWLKAKAGSWSDGSRRKPFVVLGYALSAVAKLLFVPALSWLLVLLARLVERLGKGLRGAPRDALIADTVAPGQRGAAFGWQRGMDAAGGVLGALAAWVLFGSSSYADIFLWSLLPAGAAVLLTFWLVEPPAPARSASRGASKVLPPLGAAVRRGLLAVALNTAGRLSFAFLLLQAAATPLGPHDALLLYAGYQLLYALLSAPLGRLADRCGRLPLLHAGAALLLLAYAVLALLPGVAGVALAAAAYALGEAALDTTQRAWFADLATPGQRGRVLGAYHGVVALTALPGGLALGALWGEIGVAAACALAAAFTLAGSLVLPRASAAPAG